MKTYRRFLPTLVWMGFIYYLSSRSTAGIPLTGTDRFLILKFFHLIEYSVLAFTFRLHQSPSVSVINSYLYAVTDEFHQTFTPGREGKFTDTLIDLVGIIIGLFLFQIVSCFFPKSASIRYEKNHR